MFKPFKTLHYKAKAADIVEANLKKIVGKQGLYGLSPKDANKLIKAVYDKSPDVFNGNHGLPPHHVIFAARAFMSAANDTPENDPKCLVQLSCLESIFQDIEINKAFYSFTDLDNKLLKEAVEFYEERRLSIQSIPMAQEMEEILDEKFYNWSEWFDLFKDAAQNLSPEVLEMIPLEDPSVFKAWFRMKYDPVECGRKYAVKISLGK